MVPFHNLITIFKPLLILFIAMFILLNGLREKFSDFAPNLRDESLKKIYGEAREKKKPVSGAAPFSGYIVIDRNYMEGMPLKYSSMDIMTRQHSLLRLPNRYGGSHGPTYREVFGSMNRAAFGSDLNVYFSNGFLIGYAPYETTNLWVPMEEISKKLKYALDADFFSGHKEIWQTSKEAYFRLRGDCEDHAILLADWLIEMGYNAKVVLGTYNDEGHAWVVLLLDGKDYLIETTRKRSYNSRYPLAVTMQGYKPFFMFDRAYFWKNQTPGYPHSYYTNWEKSSRFVKENPF